MIENPINQDAKALAQQKIAKMESATLDSLLALIWGRNDMPKWCITNDEKMKLIAKGIINLQYQYDVTRAGNRRLQKEIDRLCSKPELFPRSV